MQRYIKNIIKEPFIKELKFFENNHLMKSKVGFLKIIIKDNVETIIFEIQGDEDNIDEKVKWMWLGYIKRISDEYFNNKNKGDVLLINGGDE